MPNSKGKILLVEDDITLSRMYEKKFQTDGYQVVTAYDGWTASKKLLPKSQTWCF